MRCTICTCIRHLSYCAVQWQMACPIYKFNPIKIALIAPFSDEVRPTCNKISWNFPAVQMIKYQLNFILNIKIFWCYFLSRFTIWYYLNQWCKSISFARRLVLKNADNLENKKFVAFEVQFLRSWMDTHGNVQYRNFNLTMQMTCTIQTMCFLSPHVVLSACTSFSGERDKKQKTRSFKGLQGNANNISSSPTRGFRHTEVVDTLTHW